MGTLPPAAVPIREPSDARAGGREDGLASTGVAVEFMVRESDAAAVRGEPAGTGVDKMNRQELRSQAMRRLSIGKTYSDQTKGLIAAAMDTILKPYEERDQKAADRKQAPYNFNAQAVTWLERAVRQRVKL